MKKILSVRGIHFDKQKRMQNSLMKQIIKPLMEQYDIFSFDRPINWNPSNYSNYSELRKKIENPDKHLAISIVNQANNLKIKVGCLEWGDYSQFQNMPAEKEQLKKTLASKIKSKKLSKYDVLDEIIPFLNKRSDMMQQRDKDIFKNFFHSINLFDKDKICVFYGALHNWDRRVFKEYKNSKEFELYFMMPDYSDFGYGPYLNNILISRIILSKSDYEEGMQDLSQTIFLTELLSDTLKLYPYQKRKKLVDALTHNEYPNSDINAYPGDLVLNHVMRHQRSTFDDFFKYLLENKGKQIPFNEFEDRIQLLSKEDLNAVNEIMIENFYSALEYLQNIPKQNKSPTTKVF